MQHTKKQSFYKQNNINFVDYRDIDILQKFINPHGRIIPRRKTGLSAKEQRNVARAIKRARYMALIPYVSY